MHVCMYVYKLIYNILILYVYVLYIVRHQVVNPKAVHIMYVYMYACMYVILWNAPFLSNAVLIFLNDIPLLVRIHRVGQVPPLVVEHQLVRRA